jgi:exosortase/archaeosortase family protein
MIILFYCLGLISSLPLWIKMLTIGFQQESQSHVLVAFCLYSFLFLQLKINPNWKSIQAAIILLLLSFVIRFLFVYEESISFLYIAHVLQSFSVWIGCLDRLSLKKAVIGLPLLLCSIPIPGSFNVYISDPLQILIVTIVTNTLDFFGVFFISLDNVISIEDHNIFIADACNGIRILWPFLLFSYGLSIVYSFSFIQSGMMLLTGIITAFTMNTIRVLVCVFLYINDLSNLATIVHDYSGIILIGFAWYIPSLLAIYMSGKSIHSFIHTSFIKSDLETLHHPAIQFVFVISIIAFLSNLTMFVYSKVILEPPEVRNYLFPLPNHIESWYGVDRHLSEVELSILQPEFTYSRVFIQKETRHSISITAIQRKVHSQDEHHNLEECMDSIGWSTKSTDSQRFQHDRYQLVSNHHIFERFNRNQYDSISAIESILYVKIPINPILNWFSILCLIEPNPSYQLIRFYILYSGMNSEDLYENAIHNFSNKQIQKMISSLNV